MGLFSLRTVVQVVLVSLLAFVLNPIPDEMGEVDLADRSVPAFLTRASCSEP